MEYFLNQARQTSLAQKQSSYARYQEDIANERYNECMYGMRNPPRKQMKLYLEKVSEYTGLQVDTIIQEAGLNKETRTVGGNSLDFGIFDEASGLFSPSIAYPYSSGALEVSIAHGFTAPPKIYIANRRGAVNGKRQTNVELEKFVSEKNSSIDCKNFLKIYLREEVINNTYFKEGKDYPVDPHIVDATQVFPNQIYTFKTFGTQELLQNPRIILVRPIMEMIQNSQFFSDPKNPDPQLRGSEFYFIPPPFENSNRYFTPPEPSECNTYNNYYKFRDYLFLNWATNKYPKGLYKYAGCILTIPFYGPLVFLHELIHYYIGIYAKPKKWSETLFNTKIERSSLIEEMFVGVFISILFLKMLINFNEGKQVLELTNFQKKCLNKFKSYLAFAPIGSAIGVIIRDLLPNEFMS